MSERSDYLNDLINKYSDLVTKNAYAILKDYYTAEDVCQETFERLLKQEDLFRISNPRAWLFRVSRNLAYDHLRKGGQYKTYTGLDDEQYAQMGECWEGADTILEQRERYREGRRILDCLRNEKPQWYEVLLMSYLQGLDNGAIGEIFGIKPGLVSQWKHRALEWTREKYRNQEGTGNSPP